MKYLGTCLGLAVLASVAAASAQSDPLSLLDAHNAARARHCAPPLAWSPALAASAQQWANRCAFSHDPNNPNGENLAWGTGLTARDAFGLWYDEIARYDYARPGFGPAGHFTQAIWRDSKLLGCARAVCGRDVLWVCRYSPPGNVDGEFRENVSRPCH